MENITIDAIIAEDTFWRTDKPVEKGANLCNVKWPEKQ